MNTNFPLHSGDAPQSSDNSSNPDVQELRLRIAELEAELNRQKAAAEKGGKLLQLMWGYSFSRESLH